ncbi:MAG: hypothetical protein O2871_00575, partial [bacterium]|nr:hypothetical protein [bacterium]
MKLFNVLFVLLILSCAPASAQGFPQTLVHPSGGVTIFPITNPQGLCVDVEKGLGSRFFPVGSSGIAYGEYVVLTNGVCPNGLPLGK